MPITIKGKLFYRTSEALEKIGIGRTTFYRWIKEEHIEDVKRKDIRGWRLFTEEDIENITEYVAQYYRSPKPPRK